MTKTINESPGKRIDFLREFIIFSLSRTQEMGKNKGVVMDGKVFSRRDRLSKTDDELVEETSRVKDIQKEYRFKNRTKRIYKRNVSKI